jgi:hypothetical protein
LGFYDTFLEKAEMKKIFVRVFGYGIITLMAGMICKLLDVDVLGSISMLVISLIGWFIVCGIAYGIISLITYGESK